VAAVWVEGDEGHHAARVLRVKAGEAVMVMDGQGRWAEATVTAVERGRVCCEVGPGGVVMAARDRPRVTVLAPAAKGSRSDEMVEQLAQVGADRWVVLSTAQSVVEPGEGKLSKWRRRSEESSKQCGRAWDLEVVGPVAFEEALGWVGGEGVLGWVMDVGGGGSLSPRPEGPGAELSEAMVMIGPEGGWTDSERAAAESAGWARWTVGRHVMRLETAAVVGAALLVEGLHCGDE